MSPCATDRQKDRSPRASCGLDVGTIRGHAYDRSMRRKVAEFSHVDAAVLVNGEARRPKSRIRYEVGKLLVGCQAKHRSANDLTKTRFKERRVD